jgi:hypothetical protein
MKDSGDESSIILKWVPQLSVEIISAENFIVISVTWY